MSHIGLASLLLSRMQSMNAKRALPCAEGDLPESVAGVLLLVDVGVFHAEPERWTGLDRRFGRDFHFCKSELVPCDIVDVGLSVILQKMAILFLSFVVVIVIIVVQQDEGLVLL